MTTLKLKSWRKVRGAALDVIFPRTCLLCRKGVDDQHLHFCSKCRKHLHYQRAQPACPRCAYSVGPFGIRDGRCFVCRNERRCVDYLVRVGPYQDAIASLIRAFKYGGRDELDAYLGGLLAEVIELAPWSDAVDALVYVPTHWQHSVRRMFYAPKALARVVSRATSVPSVRVLRRVAGGPHQFDVPISQRAANIRGKFAMIRGAGVKGARLCLLDDVSTTGATLNECARILKKAGTSEVYAAVVAKADT